MTSRARNVAARMFALFLLLAAGTAITAGIVAVRRMPPRVQEAPVPHVARVAPASEPIREEAQLYQPSLSMVAIGPGAARERSAHPRRLSTVHFGRAYAGAPPRIPHGLSGEEFRTDGCKTCHQRGGYSLRFAAYVPVTPHADRGMCLQCHVGVDAVVGVADQAADPNNRCVLCHPATGGRPRDDARVTWPTTAWAPLPTLTPGQSPPSIPHALQFRENCLTCHGGPSAVEEIRTAHPERSDCRQCHLLADPGSALFTRAPVTIAAAARGSTP